MKIQGDSYKNLLFKDSKGRSWKIIRDEEGLLTYIRMLPGEQDEHLISKESFDNRFEESKILWIPIMPILKKGKRK